MTDIKQRDLIKLVEQNGFKFIRNSKHIIYRKNDTVLAIPHTKIIKRNTFKDIKKRMESA